MEVNVYNLFDKLHLSVVTLSGDSDKWSVIKDYVDKIPSTETVDLIFHETSLENPLDSPIFIELTEYKNVRFVIYYSNKTCDEIEAFFEFQGLDTSRVIKVENECKEVRAPYSPSKFDWFRNITTVTPYEDHIELKTVSTTSSISTTNIFMAYQDAVKYFENKYKLPATKLTFDFQPGGNASHENTFAFFDMVNDYREKGVEFNVLNFDAIELMSKYIYWKKSKMKNATKSQRIKYIDSYLKKNQVVLLERKVRRKVKNALGETSGLQIYQRPALYKGVQMTGDIKVFMFQTFPVYEFTTKLDHKMKLIDKDEYIEDSEDEYILHPEDVCVPVDHLSSMLEEDKVMLGNEFTVYRCIQTRPGMEESIYDTVDGKITHVKYILPEFVKKVLDDHEVEYNREELDNDIAESKESLGIN